MTENNPTPSNDPKKLADEELSEVMGGMLEPGFYNCLNSLPYKDEIYDYVTFGGHDEEGFRCYERLIMSMSEHGDGAKSNKLWDYASTWYDTYSGRRYDRQTKIWEPEW